MRVSVPRSQRARPLTRTALPPPSPQRAGRASRSPAPPAPSSAPSRAATMGSSSASGLPSRWANALLHRAQVEEQLIDLASMLRLLAALSAQSKRRCVERLGQQQTRAAFVAGVGFVRLPLPENASSQIAGRQLSPKFVERTWRALSRGEDVENCAVQLGHGGSLPDEIRRGDRHSRPALRTPALCVWRRSRHERC